MSRLSCKLAPLAHVSLLCFVARALCAAADARFALHLRSLRVRGGRRSLRSPRARSIRGVLFARACLPRFVRVAPFASRSLPRVPARGALAAFAHARFEWLHSAHISARWMMRRFAKHSDMRCKVTIRHASSFRRSASWLGVLESPGGCRLACLLFTWLERRGRAPGFHPLSAPVPGTRPQPRCETIQNKGSFETDHWNFRILREQQHWTQSLLTVRGPLQQDVAVQEAPMPFRESAGHGVPASSGPEWFSVTCASLT